MHSTTLASSARGALLVPIAFIVACSSAGTVDAGVEASAGDTALDTDRDRDPRDAAPDRADRDAVDATPAEAARPDARAPDARDGSVVDGGADASAFVDTAVSDAADAAGSDAPVEAAVVDGGLRDTGGGPDASVAWAPVTLVPRSTLFGSEPDLSFGAIAMVVDDTGGAHVAVGVRARTDFTTFQRRLLHGTRAGGTWRFETVATSPDSAGAYSCDIALRAGVVYIASAQDALASLALVRRVGTTWEPVEVPREAAPATLESVRDVSLAADGDRLALGLNWLHRPGSSLSSPRSEIHIASVRSSLWSSWSSVDQATLRGIALLPSTGATAARTQAAFTDAYGTAVELGVVDDTAGAPASRTVATRTGLPPGMDAISVGARVMVLDDAGRANVVFDAQYACGGASCDARLVAREAADGGFATTLLESRASASPVRARLCPTGTLHLVSVSPSRAPRFQRESAGVASSPTELSASAITMDPGTPFGAHVDCAAASALLVYSSGGGLYAAEGPLP